MSIYASLPGIEDAYWYRTSGILPSATDPQTSKVGLAFIPSHITRDGRDDQPEDGAPWPWLRVDVFNGDDWEGATAVINPAQARDLARQLTEWADSAEPTEYEEH